MGLMDYVMFKIRQAFGDSASDTMLILLMAASVLVLAVALALFCKWAFKGILWLIGSPARIKAVFIIILLAIVISIIWLVNSEYWDWIKTLLIVGD